MLRRAIARLGNGEVKPYRLIIFAVTASVFLCGQFAKAQSDWVDDYKKAQEEAKTNNKFILLNFTGSDWCGWCIKFDKEVFSQPQFKDYAHNNLVLVELDFPRRKPQSPDLQKHLRVSYNRRAKQQWTEAVAIRRLLLWRPGSIHRTTAEIAEGLGCRLFCGSAEIAPGVAVRYRALRSRRPLLDTRV